ncbi:hypothetical protein [Acidianus brierleyi]|uniref:Uncharacterized protein n=1 Tax=Acidianus brierleyi TaxID=41673 RepID=A0A2U9IHN9_9CREN|nr:hypothetical protein [Acidianus brierleyi]AWR95495.1 hypothetical protein DFR85_13720 [Acidianus brierleyi]
MAFKVLFLTKDKKFIYDGKVREVRQLEDLEGINIRFSRPMIVYDVEEVDLDYFTENFGHLLVGDKTVVDLVHLLKFSNFIAYVDHYRNKIELFIDGNKYIELSYSSLPFLRYLFAKIPRGILLENTDFYSINPD